MIPAMKAPTPVVSFDSRPLVANSSPSERTPVRTATSSTTSATIEPTMMKPSTTRAPAIMASTTRIGISQGEPLAGIRPSSLSDMGVRAAIR